MVEQNFWGGGDKTFFWGGGAKLLGGKTFGGRHNTRPTLRRLYESYGPSSHVADDS